MTFSIDSVRDELEGHMDDQPYSISCAECGETLDFKSSYDNDLDLTVEVTPCWKCMEDVKDE